MTAPGLPVECEVCEAPAVLQRPENRPSLSAVVYRLGTFERFREAMLDAIGRDPVLSGLASGAPDDHAVTMVELWAAVADVLTFYNERYANEVWLGTASQQRAIERLARLVGYRPRPGLAAEAWLAFTLQAGPSLAIPQGFPVQSVPAAGQTPQTYETLAPLTADARLNALPARLSTSPAAAPFGSGTASFVVDRMLAPALGATLKPNDRVVLWGGGGGGAGVEERTISAVRTDRDQVSVEWTTPVQGLAGSSPSARRFKRTLPVFGSHAPSDYLDPQSSPSSAGGIRWVPSTTNYAVPGSTTELDIEGRIEDVPAGSELLVVTAADARLVTVTAVRTGTTKVGPVADSTTKLTVTALPAYDRRTVRVYLLDGPSISGWGDRYPAASLGTTIAVPAFASPQPDGAPAVELGRRIEKGDWVRGDVLRLDELEIGRVLLIGAVPPAVNGGSADDVPPVLAYVRDVHVEPASAVATDGAFCHLVLDLDRRGSLPDQVDQVVVWGNVVRASHGETAVEVLGDGDASTPFQELPLRKKPLTYLPATVPGGAASTLSVFVDGVRRDEVASLYGQPPAAPVYSTATQPDGTTDVRFGDGATGARLPTGRSNVTARYRVGSGLVGRVDASQLRTAIRPMVGVQKVTNPLPSEGGADPEPPGTARANAPRSVRTLGRAVSLRDLEDLVTESGLIAKSQATWAWDGFDRAIHLTVAAQLGAPLGAQQLSEMVASLNLARDINRKLTAADYAPVPVQLAANVTVDPRAEDPAAVVTAVRTAALMALSFDAVSLGRPLHVSDVIAVLASVPLVLGVDVDLFGFLPTSAMTPAELDRRGVTRRADGSVAPVQGNLRFFPARPGGGPGRTHPAELPVIVNASRDVVVIEGPPA